MGWSNAWPVGRWDVPDEADVFNDLVAAQDEREALIPAGETPSPFARHALIAGAASSATAGQAVVGFQQQIAGTIQNGVVWRWWDRSRGGPLTLENLLADTIGRTAWTHDLQAAGASLTPPFPVILNELYAATNGLTTVRRAATLSQSARSDSLYHLTFGINDWPTDRAAAFAELDGEDDGVSTGLVFDVGLAATLSDSGSDQQWTIEAREASLAFDTAALSGLTIAAAWLELTTAAPPGSTDFSDTFTVVVANAEGTSRGTFASDDHSLHTVALTPSDIDTAGQTELILRSTRAPSDDRPAWAATAPDYSSTYREGVDLGDTLRLIVEVQFDYHA